MRALISFCFLCALVLIPSVLAFSQSTDASIVKTSSPIAAPSPVKEDQYRIGFQDQLEVQVFNHPNLTQRYNVSKNGTITPFRLNEPIVAVCKTETELADDIKAAYAKDYLRNPEVKVLAVEQRSRAFAVMGAVEKPAQYMVSRRVWLLELLALAGGPSKEAGTRIIVARLGSTSNCKMEESAIASTSTEDNIEVLSFKLSSVMEAKENLIMRPGDVVYVLDADIIYVYGNVNKQGQVPIKEPLTLTQAIASAEGLKAASDKSKIRVLRQKPGSMDRDELVYDLNKINKRETPDPFLEPNDVVAVSTDQTKEIFQNIGRSLTNGISSLFYRVP